MRYQNRMSKRQIKQYRDTHNYCEACGSSEGCEVAYIRSVKVGGSSEHRNLLLLCFECRYAVMHTGGFSALIEKHPRIREKVLYVRPKLREFV